MEQKQKPLRTAGMALPAAGSALRRSSRCLAKHQRLLRRRNRLHRRWYPSIRFVRARARASGIADERYVPCEPAGGKQLPPMFRSARQRVLGRPECARATRYRSRSRRRRARGDQAAALYGLGALEDRTGRGGGCSSRGITLLAQQRTRGQRGGGLQSGDGARRTEVVPNAQAILRTTSWPSTSARWAAAAAPASDGRSDTIKLMQKRRAPTACAQPRCAGQQVEAWVAWGMIVDAQRRGARQMSTRRPRYCRARFRIRAMTLFQRWAAEP
jgi:hypothetical protein